MRVISTPNILHLPPGLQPDLILKISFEFFIGLHAQVTAIQEESAKLQAAYAGDKAMEITNREREVVRAWLELQNIGDSRKSKLNDTSDLFKFFAMVSKFYNMYCVLSN